MPRKLALLIGVSDYGEGFDPLSAPVKDVAALQQVLENPEMGHFDQVKTLTNPGLMEMRRAIGTLFSTSQKEDLVLLFFSGHGVTDDDYRLYLTTKSSSKDSFRFDSLEASYIQNFSDSAYAKRQVIILDCCYSGAFAEGWQRKGEVKLELERELGKEGRVVLTSSSSTQVSFQQEDGELSLYTQYLVEGMETGAADKGKQGAIRVRELHEYAKGKVQEVKPKLKPDIIVADDEGYDIVLSRVKVDAALRFRRVVEKYADPQQGEIRSRRAKEILETRARNWGLTPDAAAQIIASVLEPSRRRLKSLERYRQEYEEEIAAQGYPLDAETLEELRDWQQTVLGLEDRDVKPVQREIESRYGGQSEHPSDAPQPSTPPLVKPEFSSLKSFSFEVVRVDAQGEITYQEQQQAKGFGEDLGSGVTLEMMQIPEGCFVMGSPKQEGGFDYERPQHEVRVPSFFMGKCAVTQAQYEAVMGTNPATRCDADRFVAPNKPVVGVSWHDAIAFCEKLSQQTGQTYRLPSEAEWEYACRAGTETPFHFGETVTTDLANYRGTDWQCEGNTYPGNYGDGPKGEYREKTTTVGFFPANAFGLFDMHGNVWERCQDHWHDSYENAPSDSSPWLSSNEEAIRVLRGGSWDYFPEDCRSAFRFFDGPADHNLNVGFRVVCGSARISNSAE